jgi:heat shock protein HslJ
MVNNMKTVKLLFPVLAAVVLLALIMPAVAYPIKGDAASIEGAGCIAARSAFLQDSTTFSLSGYGSRAGLLQADTQGCLAVAGYGRMTVGAAPGSPSEGSLFLKAAALQAATMQSEKEALISRLAGRTVSPRDTGTTSSTLVSGEGIVRFIEHDGGFYGIVTTDGQNFLPENLPASMKVNGTRVRFDGVVRAGSSSTGTWGTPISLITITLPPQGFSGVGTVRFIELEGGFYGIITPEGDNYLPLNLPREFQVDGLKVTFSAREERDVATIVMWGTPVRIDTIARFGPQTGELGGSWSLVTIDGEPLIPGTTITANFESGQVTGAAGCNQYFASYSTAGTTLSIGGAGSTKMYCTSPAGVMEQEGLYLSLLEKASSFTLEEGKLVIRDSSGESLLVFASALDHSAETFIEYTRTGGFAGFNDHLVISSDGTATVTRKESVRQVLVPELTMRKLTAHLSAADFRSLKDKYPAPQEGADYFTYTLTHDGKTVVTEDTGVPPILVPIINTLNEIIERSAPDDVIPSVF